MICIASVFCKGEEHGGFTPTLRLRRVGGPISIGRGGWIKMTTDFLGDRDVAGAVSTACACLDETEQPLGVININEEDLPVLRNYYRRGP